MNIPLTPLRFLDRARQQFGSKTGVVDGDRSWTYAEYDSRCRRLANLIRSWDLPAATPTAFLAYNTHHLLEAYYGVPLAGNVFLPLNIRLAAEDFQFILDDCRASALFFHADFLPQISRIRRQLKKVKRFVLLDEVDEPPSWVEAHSYDGLLDEQSPKLDFDVMAVDEDSVAEIFYTSGTSGHPKGVQLTHRNLYLHALEAALAVEGSDRDVQLHTIPLFHVNGWGTPQFLTCLGGCHIMLPKFEPQLVFRAIQDHGVTVFSLVPTMAISLVNAPERQGCDFSSLRLINIGGAASNYHLVRQVEETFGCRCLAGYGLTETSPALTIARAKSHLGAQDRRRMEIQATTGYPLPGAELEIWDEEGEPLPWDGRSVGEIVVRADMVMSGYWNRPQENLEAFQGGWFHTGDLASIDPDGYLLIVDRKKDIIISGGENISSLEVEKAVLAHPSVLECAVIAVPDSQWGEVPMALVVLKDGQEASEEELIEFTRNRLAHFKAPRRVAFYDEFPKGGTGKILKRELREKYWASEKKRVH